MDGNNRYGSTQKCCYLQKIHINIRRIWTISFINEPDTAEIHKMYPDIVPTSTFFLLTKDYKKKNPQLAWDGKLQMKVQE